MQLFFVVIIFEKKNLDASDMMQMHIFVCMLISNLSICDDPDNRASDSGCDENYRRIELMIVNTKYIVRYKFNLNHLFTNASSIRSMQIDESNFH